MQMMNSFGYNNRYRQNAIIPKIVYDYNNTIHAVIEATPQEA